MRNQMVVKTPPMGWNSWNTFFDKVSDELLCSVADAMVAQGLLSAGYEYLIVDDGWLARERDENGHQVPDPKKFPRGIKPVIDYIHEKGLKFGIYSCCGTHTCGGYPGSFEHEFEDAKQYADWGVDYLKYDNCYRSQTTSSPLLYRRIAMALRASGRDILLAACQWGTEDVHQWIRSCGAHTFRSTVDIQDAWNSIQKIALSQMELQGYAGPNCFNDMDMLVVGMYGKGNVGLGGCNDVQYRTHYSIWALFGSPLMIGCDIRNMNEETKKILENKELIAINQDPLCRQPIRLDGIWSGDDVLIYSRQLSNGDLAIGFFNLKDESVVANLNLDEVGLPMSTGKTLQMKEVWTGEDLPSLNGTVRKALEPYGCAVYRCKVVDL